VKMPPTVGWNDTTVSEELEKLVVEKARPSS
jgi:hypothetical protein